MKSPSHGRVYSFPFIKEFSIVYPSYSINKSPSVNDYTMKFVSRTPLKSSNFNITFKLYLIVPPYTILALLIASVSFKAVGF